VSRQWVNKWRNQDHGFMEALAESREVMRAMHMNRICLLMDRAIMILEEAMEGEDEKARLKTAMYVMKLSGLQGFAKPPQVISQEDQTLQALQQALGQVAEEMGFGKGYPR
jgi:small-conductance mechanosensitive channel